MLKHVGFEGWDKVCASPACTVKGVKCKWFCGECFSFVCDEHREAHLRAPVHNDTVCVKIPEDSSTHATATETVRKKVAAKTWTETEMTPALFGGTAGTFTPISKLCVEGFNLDTGATERYAMDCSFCDEHTAIEHIVKNKPNWLKSVVWKKVPSLTGVPGHYTLVEMVQVVGNRAISEESLTPYKEWRADLAQKCLTYAKNATKLKEDTEVNDASTPLPIKPQPNVLAALNAVLTLMKAGPRWTTRVATQTLEVLFAGGHPEVLSYAQEDVERAIGLECAPEPFRKDALVLYDEPGLHKHVAERTDLAADLQVSLEDGFIARKRAYVDGPPKRPRDEGS